MTTQPKLESYLTSLDRALKPFPISDRAEIVTEIKSHVLSTLEQDPSTSLDTILSALGEPETVANRYLMERELKLTKPPISPIVKWIVIGFLGTSAIFLLFAGMLVFKFSPLIHIDGQQGKVSLLGGLIDINEEEDHVTIGGIGSIKKKNGRHFFGNIPVLENQSISIDFENGKFLFNNDKSSALSWDCKAQGSQNNPEPATTKKEVRLNFKSLSWANCTIGVPKNSKLLVNGSNGKMEFNQPHFHLTANLLNGKVLFDPEKELSYQYDLQVTHGSTDSFISSNSEEGYSVVVHVTNGKISR